VKKALAALLLSGCGLASAASFELPGGEMVQFVGWSKSALIGAYAVAAGVAGVPGVTSCGGDEVLQASDITCIAAGGAYVSVRVASVDQAPACGSGQIREPASGACVGGLPPVEDVSAVFSVSFSMVMLSFMLGRGVGVVLDLVRKG